jgi:hypothetical protein
VTVIIFSALFLCRAQLWADSLVVPYSEQTSRLPSQKVVCSHHFSEADFTFADCIHLNKMVSAAVRAGDMKICTGFKEQSSAPCSLDPILSCTWKHGEGQLH